MAQGLGLAQLRQLGDVGGDARRAHDWLALSRLHVVPDVEDWSAPSVMAALASVVHDRQAAASHEHH
jgi:hypothetical protein